MARRRLCAPPPAGTSAVAARLAAQPGHAATRGPLLPPQPPQLPPPDWPPATADLSSGRVLGVRLCFLPYFPFQPLSKSRWERAVEMGPGRAQVCAPASGAMESRERRRAGDSGLSGPWELLNGRFPRCLLPPAFPPRRISLLSSLQSLLFSFFFPSPFLGRLPPKLQHFIRIPLFSGSLCLLQIWGYSLLTP